MLDELAGEWQVLNRHRNRVVAATGTNKQWPPPWTTAGCAPELNRPAPAALRRALQGYLDQSLRTYRKALVDPTLGEMYVAGARPERWDQVFASVQSLQSYGVTNIPTDAYDVVVIVE
jgi:hypothetical protein